MTRKTLNDYLLEQIDDLSADVETAEPKPKYIAVYYTKETSEKLRQWCYDNGFDLSVKYNGEEQRPEDFKFHTTIIYSTSLHSDIENEDKTIDTKSVEPVAFECLGEDKDIPVLKVTGEGILSLREYYTSAYNMTDAWSDYKPHISLSYLRRDYSDILKNLQLPDFDLDFDTITVQDIIEDKKDGNDDQQDN